MECSGLVQLLNKFISEIRSIHVVMFLYTRTMGREGKERGGGTIDDKTHVSSW